MNLSVFASAKLELLRFIRGRTYHFSLFVRHDCSSSRKCDRICPKIVTKSETSAFLRESSNAKCWCSESSDVQTSFAALGPMKLKVGGALRVFAKVRSPTTR